MRQLLLALALLTAFLPAIAQIDHGPYTPTLPETIVAGVSTEITLTFPAERTDTALTVTLNNQSHTATVAADGLSATFEHTFNGSDKQASIRALNHDVSEEVNPIPLWLSILPPLIAIAMALIFREVLSALLVGIFSGAAVMGAYNGGIAGIGSGLFSVIDTYILESLADSSHLSVILFSMTIGAVVAVISKNGGMRGVVNIVSKYARTAKSGQLGTWLLGVLIFFDDYANTLVVGNTMRAVTDRLRISREKLAYLVDSTAAPMVMLKRITERCDESASDSRM